MLLFVFVLCSFSFCWFVFKQTQTEVTALFSNCCYIKGRNALRYPECRDSIAHGENYIYTIDNKKI